MNDERETPQALFDALNGIFCFNLDAAATAANAKCEHYLTKERDALVVSWADELQEYRDPAVFCNPPASRGQLGQWIKKAHFEAQAGVATVMLLPSDSSTRWFHMVLRLAKVYAVRGRFDFSGGNPAKFGTLLAFFGFPYIAVCDVCGAVPGTFIS